MRILTTIFCLLFSAGAVAQQEAPSISPDQALSRFTEHGGKIDGEPIRRAAMIQNGRIKPLDTLAREVSLYLTGSYGRFGLSAVQFYLALASTPAAPAAQVIEIRDVELRTRLGYLRDKRFFSLNELAASELPNLAQPLFRKEEEGGKLNSEDKKVTEAFQQMSLAQQVITGANLIQSIDFSFINASHGSGNDNSGQGEVAAKAKEYLQALAANAPETPALAKDLVERSQRQPAPELFQHYISKIDAEIFYNDSHVFLIASLLALLAGLLFSLDITRARLNRKIGVLFYVLALIPLVIGIALRVYVTQFAPVTNMFTTMLWVALGVNVFSFILFALYGNFTVSGFLLIGSGLVLMLTEKIPLILSPDLDPLVAVLRSNFWLSTHVTTITISYAAFTIAMILGNVALFKIWIPGDHSKFIKEYAHYTYRMIQLGCFLLSVGIILGGVWADYSWGRFWGWDPKETWALIADMGFLALLHARFVGWVTPFTLLAYSPIAYLLVIMAWYGVNFILASGLHSYGFSSGGATMVAIFVTVQVLFIVSSLLKKSATISRV